MSKQETQVQSRFPILPFERWVSNRILGQLTHAFFNAGGQTGTPYRPDGTLDPAQEAGGWVGTFAPDAETAKQWRAETNKYIHNHRL